MANCLQSDKCEMMDYICLPTVRKIWRISVVGEALSPVKFTPKNAKPLFHMWDNAESSKNSFGNNIYTKDVGNDQKM